MEPTPVRKFSIMVFFLGVMAGGMAVWTISAVPHVPLKAFFPGFGWENAYWQQARQEADATPAPTPTPTPTPVPSASSTGLTSTELGNLLRAYLDDPKRCSTGYCSGGLVNSVIYGIISGPSDDLKITYYTYAGDHKAPYDATKWVKHVESVGSVAGLVEALGQCEMGAHISGSTLGCPQNPRTEFCAALLANGGGMAKEADDPDCQVYNDSPDYQEMYNSPNRLR